MNPGMSVVLIPGAFVKFGPGSSPDKKRHHVARRYR